MKPYSSSRKPWQETLGHFVADREQYGADKEWVLLKEIPVELCDDDDGGGGDDGDDDESVVPSQPPSAPASQQP